MQRMYYVEFYTRKIDAPYLIQSKWFDTLRQAKSWYAKNFDYVGIDARIMSTTVDEEGNWGDMEWECDL